MNNESRPLIDPHGSTHKTGKQKFAEYALLGSVGAGFAAGAAMVYWWAYNNAVSHRMWDVCGIYVPGPVRTYDRIVDAVASTPFAFIGGLVGSTAAVFAGAIVAEGIEKIAYEIDFYKKKFGGRKNE